jgi:hypothetical protein
MQVTLTERPPKRRQALQQPTDQLAGINLTGEFSSSRRRAYDVPVDAPAQHVKQQLRAEVEDSLRDVCGNWPTGDFDRIVSDVTATAIKYHGRERRRRDRTRRSVVQHIPGATAIISFVILATHTVQKFLQTETLPLG